MAIVHLIDDDEDVRRAVSFLLRTAGFTVRVYESAVGFLGVAGELDAGCIVTDIRMPEMDGLELQRTLKRKGLDIPVIVITGHGDMGLATAAIRAGAVDFIEKPFADEVLLSAVQSALSESAGTKQDSSASIRERAQGLSEKEREVFHGMVEGMPNKAIAQKLGLSAAAMEATRAAVMSKMGAQSISDLIRMAVLGQLLQ